MPKKSKKPKALPSWTAKEPTIDDVEDLRNAVAAHVVHMKIGLSEVEGKISTIRDLLPFLQAMNEKWDDLTKEDIVQTPNFFNLMVLRLGRMLRKPARLQAKIDDILV